jgi:hypothetical protein
VKAVLDEGMPEDIVARLRRLGAAIDPFRPEWRGLVNGVRSADAAGTVNLDELARLAPFRP